MPADIMTQIIVNLDTHFGNNEIITMNVINNGKSLTIFNREKQHRQQGNLKMVNDNERR